jgi:hypothetical protein
LCKGTFCLVLVFKNRSYKGGGGEKKRYFVNAVVECINKCTINSDCCHCLIAGRLSSCISSDVLSKTCLRHRELPRKAFLYKESYLRCGKPVKIRYSMDKNLEHVMQAQWSSAVFTEEIVLQWRKRVSWRQRQE